jgi:hypothetical protein
MNIDMTKSEDLNTAEEYYRSGEYSCRLGQEKSQLEESEKVVEACGKAASKDFWNALTLGHGRAAYPLYLCFDEGIGVNKNDYIAKLMFGVALKFNDARCTGDQVTIPKSMQPNINSLAKLVQNAHSKLPAKGVSMEIVFEQMDIFNKAIKLTMGKTIQSCFTEKISKYLSREKDLKSKTLELTKNLAIHNKTAINTINHLSNKAKVSSRIGCNIS